MVTAVPISDTASFDAIYRDRDAAGRGERKGMGRGERRGQDESRDGRRGARRRAGGDALRDELKRVLRMQTGGLKGAAAQRAKLVNALRAEEARERFPGLWVEGEMPDPDPQLMPRKGEE